MQTGGVITVDQATEIVKALTDKPKDAATPTPDIPTSAKLEKFIHFCRAGASTAQALKDSGILSPETTDLYVPGVDSELAIEELFYDRVASKNQPVLTDDQWMQLTPQERADHNKRGALCTSQLHKLVDWLYFNRTLPLKAIASAIQVSANEVAAIKAAISNDFAKVLKSQNGEAYIGDLLRTKELIRADIASRKAKLPASDRQHVMLDRLIWEIDNKFIDRLQEIGYINKSLGRIDVHEEWEVTIGAAGQPVNTKLKNVSQFDADRLQQDETIDVSATVSAFPLDTELNSQAKALAMPIPTPLDSGPCEGVADKGRQDSAFIKVGTDQ
jgi:hypothetical protein